MSKKITTEVNLPEGKKIVSVEITIFKNSSTLIGMGLHHSTKRSFEIPDSKGEVF